MDNKITRFFKRKPKNDAWMEPFFPAPGELDSTTVEKPSPRPAPPDPRAKVRPPKKPHRLGSREVSSAKGDGLPDYEVVASLDQLPGAVSQRILLCGHAVFATMSSQEDAPGVQFMAVQSRSTVGKLRGIFSPAAKRQVYVWVPSELWGTPKTRYALALDSYLQWGFTKSKAVTVVLGGAESGGHTYLDLLVFEDRKLVDIGEKDLPGASDPTFQLALKAVIEGIQTRHPGARIVAAAPLPDWGIVGVQYLGEPVLGGLAFKPLAARRATVQGRSLAVALLVAGFAAYGLQLAFGWKSFTTARQAYSDASTDEVVRSAGGINNARLELLQLRDGFMTEERRQEGLASRSTGIVAGIASLPGVQIRRISFGRASSQNAAGSPENAAGDTMEADVSMELLIPKAGDSALQDAEALMTVISSRTGMKLRLAKSAGWSTDEASGIRTLRIEGFTQ